MTLARSLAESDLTVILIERGGSVARTPKRDVIFKSLRYDGIHNGIAFGYGGAGTLWGGQLLPMLRPELISLGKPWSSDEFAGDLSRHYRTIESWLGVTLTPYDEMLLEEINHKSRGLKWSSFTPLYSKWIPFRRRNLGAAWQNELRRSGKVHVLLHSRPTEWGLADSGETNTICSVVCSSAVGQATRIEARYYVIAAGALESPLILQKMLGNSIAETLGVGRMLHDHLSLRVAEIIDLRREEFEQMLSPFFMGTTMRSLRLCLSSEQGGERCPWAYCHFVIEAPPGSGFALARDFLRGLQAKKYMAAVNAMMSLPSAVGDITRMLWLRYIKRRLSLSKGSRIFVNVDFVQSPSTANSIRSTIDAGEERIEVDWNITEDITAQVERALNALTVFWDENRLQRTGRIEPVRYDAHNGPSLDNIYDIYHPAGTCAMGRVVDADLKIYGLSNGYVVGSSVLPMLGRSNPTLTIMALALRLAGHIAATHENGRARGSA